ncbi:dnaJ homolog subfamily C member 3 [Patella vulgata]|uniref:dnaJ homolog subfamily C member 3 n=1 Tax=Patella vulgata TaxID=6465 RepID=UPI00217F2DFD|nr:dnaJ homolog subfamily C member 3 [Patella vulgata]
MFSNMIGFGRFIQSLCVCLLTFDIQLFGLSAGANPEVEQHLEMGKKLLAAGQLADALSHYHAAVEGDPDNYMTYFKRATVYLALGKSRSALPDLEKVVKLRPDFTAARIQRGSVLLKQGKYQDARDDFATVLRKNPNSEEAAMYIHKIDELPDSISLAYRLYEENNYQDAIEVLGQIVEVCPWDPTFHEIRSECYEAQGDLFKAASDLRQSTKLRADNTKGYYKLSKLHYEMGEADESLNQIRECLKLDPDHKQCFPHYKKVKKLVKLMTSAQELTNEEQYDECVKKAEQMEKIESEVFHYVLKAASHRCKCYSRGGHFVQAIKQCTKILEMDPDNLEALVDRAEAHIINENYEEAINDYQTASNIDGENRRVKEGLNKANKLLKQSKKRDYYKILGVKRNASKKQILKAYRKLAVKWHPDKFTDEEKAAAQKKFIDIAAAKEVLTDPEKRRQFDQGEDPLDPEEQNRGGGNPFQHGFNPFGSGGSFKFHFN